MRIWTRTAQVAAVIILSAQSSVGKDQKDVVEAAQDAQIVILGEVHDNPHHHMAQAAAVAALRPNAVVWEMLTPDQAALLTPTTLAEPRALADLLDWDASGWPDFFLYLPIFEAAAQAQHFGAAVPREVARAAMEAGLSQAFGGDAARFGLDAPLPEAEQTAREADQLAAHCDALPVEMLPAMVDIQRLRDARLAQVALQAKEEAGGLVAIITGNGHARRDRGVPVYLLTADPTLRIFSLGQAEEGVVQGQFDMVLDAAAVDRPDPCAAFR